MTLHRIPEDYLIALALETGFRVAGVSEINANAKDPEDIIVHRLPPRSGRTRRARDDAGYRRIRSYDTQVCEALMVADTVESLRIHKAVRNRQSISELDCAYLHSDLMRCL